MGCKTADKAKQCRVTLLPTATGRLHVGNINFETLHAARWQRHRMRLSNEVSTEVILDAFNDDGFHYGPSLKCLSFHKVCLAS